MSEDQMSTSEDRAWEEMLRNYGVPQWLSMDYGVGPPPMRRYQITPDGEAVNYPSSRNVRVEVLDEVQDATPVRPHINRLFPPGVQIINTSEIPAASHRSGRSAAMVGMDEMSNYIYERNYGLRDAVREQLGDAATPTQQVRDDFQREVQRHIRNLVMEGETTIPDSRAGWGSVLDSIRPLDTAIDTSNLRPHGVSMSYTTRREQELAAELERLRAENAALKQELELLRLPKGTQLKLF